MSAQNRSRSSNKFQDNPFVQSIGGLMQTPDENKDDAAGRPKKNFKGGDGNGNSRGRTITAKKGPTGKGPTGMGPTGMGSTTGKGPDRDPDSGIYCTDDARFALSKIVEKNMRVVVCTVNGDSGIALVGQPVPLTEGDLEADLTRGRATCKGHDKFGYVVVVRPTNEKMSKVYQITCEGMGMRAKMILANASLWVRINGDCYARGNETHLDKVEEINPSLFANSANK